MRTNFSRIKIPLSSITFIVVMIVIICSMASAQGVAINNSLAPPNQSAGLDIDFIDKGLLIPRVELTSISSYFPLPLHLAGMLVYNVTTSQSITPGLYFSNGINWVNAILEPGNSTGALPVWNGKKWTSLSIGLPGQQLQLDQQGLPVWINLQ